MKLYVKYMVSLRCKMVVKDELKKIGIDYIFVDLITKQVSCRIFQGSTIATRTAR